HQRSDRGTLPGTDDKVAFPMPGPPAGLDRRRSLPDRLHVGGLLQGALTRTAPSPTMPVGSAGAQVDRIRWNDQSAKDRFVDGFSAHMPARAACVTPTQPPTDLGWRPLPAQLVRHGLAERAVDGEPSRLGPPAAYIGLVVCVPRLIPPIRLPVAGDLSVHGLVALADPGSDRLDRLVTAEPIGDFDS